MNVHEVVYLNRDNPIELQLLEGGVVQNLSTISRMVVDLDGLSIDSDTAAAGTFDWTTDPTKLVLKLGAVTGIDAKTGRKSARLTVYAVDYPNGLVWTEALNVWVKA